MEGRRFGFEEITYLLLFGSLPTEPQLNDFNEILSIYRELPDTFVRDVVMKATSKNMMNTLQRCVLTLYSYDEKPDDISIPNVLRQALSLIAKMPLIAVTVPCIPPLPRKPEPDHPKSETGAVDR